MPLTSVITTGTFILFKFGENVFYKNFMLKLFYNCYSNKIPMFKKDNSNLICLWDAVFTLKKQAINNINNIHYSYYKKYLKLVQKYKFGVIQPILA